MLGFDFGRVEEVNWVFIVFVILGEFKFLFLWSGCINERDGNICM